MAITRLGELVFEAVPGLVLQLIAALTTEKNTTSAFVSLFISTASAALVGTTMFYDLDTSPAKRKGDPGTYPLSVIVHPLPFLTPPPPRMDRHRP
jgi:hypothetical protein